MAAPHSVTLTWAEADSVSGYNIYRAVSPAVPVGAQGTPPGIPINATPVTVLAYVDTNVTGDVAYNYIVEAVSAAGVSSTPSNQAAAVIPPAAPTNLVAVAV